MTNETEKTNDQPEAKPPLTCAMARGMYMQNVLDADKRMLKRLHQYEGIISEAAARGASAVQLPVALANDEEGLRSMRAAVQMLRSRGFTVVERNNGTFGVHQLELCASGWSE